MKHFRLWAVCLALTLLAIYSAPTSAQAPVKAPSPAAPTLTGTIAKISIVGLKNIPADTVLPKLTLKVGDTYTPEAAAKDAAAIKSMGVFNGQVTVAATPASPNGVNLAYTVSENPVVQSIKFTTDAPNGKPSVPFSELFSQMQTKVGQVLNTNVLVKDLDSLFNHTNGYALKQGHIFDVSDNVNIDPKNGVLTIPLVEYYIHSIQITGNSRIKTADILTQMHTKPGDLYDGNALNNDESLIYEMGQFRQVNGFTSQIDAAGKISITIPVVEQAAATGVLDEKQGKVIPFLYDALTVSYPVVQVSVNGRSPLPFVVDTGTTAPLLLAPWAAKELGLSPSSRVEEARNFTYSRTLVKNVILQGVSHDKDAAFDTPETLVTDLSLFDQLVPRPHIAGVVGVGLLVSATSRFDFAAKTLTIWTAPHPPLSVPGGTTLPLRIGSVNLFTVHAVFAPDASADLVLDTGSDGTQIPLSALRTLHPAAMTFNNFAGKIDGISVFPELKLPSLRLGTLLIPNVTVGTLQPPESLSLGMDVLAGYRVTLDGPNARLILEPSPRGGSYTLGRSGLSIKQSGNGWSVSTLSSGAPAQDAGLKVGDKIVSVNGVSVAGTPVIFCLHLLGGIEGSRLQVIVQRGKSKPFVVSWVASDVSHVPPMVIDGLPMRKPNGGSWVILQVMKGYPGDKAELQAGDTLTRVNGEATAIMSLNRFAELAKKPMVLLEVERAGVAKPFSVRLTALKPPR